MAVNNLAWQDESFKMIALEAGDEITTPFTDVIGDNIRLYMINAHDGRLMITDDGNTINNLDMLGIDVADPASQIFIQEVLNRTEIRLTDDGVLQVTGQVEDCDLMMQHLIQAIGDIEKLIVSDK